MNKLRNSTHTRLIPVAVLGANVLIRHSARSSRELSGLNLVLDGEKNELPFARGAIDEHFEFAAHPTFNIGFEESEITGRRDAVAFLAATVNAVEEVIEATGKRSLRA